MAKGSSLPVSLGTLVNQTPIPNSSPRTCFQVPASVCWEGGFLPLVILLDLRGEANLLDQSLKQAEILLQQLLRAPVPANDLDGFLLAKPTHGTQPPTVIILGNHCET